MDLWDRRRLATEQAMSMDAERREERTSRRNRFNAEYHSMFTPRQEEAAPGSPSFADGQGGALPGLSSAGRISSGEESAESYNIWSQSGSDREFSALMVRRSMGSGWGRGGQDRQDRSRGYRPRRRTERESFISARFDVVREALLQVNVVYFASLLMGLFVIFGSTYFEIKSVYILVVTHGYGCDRPLWSWLLCFVIICMMRELALLPAGKNHLLALQVAWTACGFVCVQKCVTCAQTSPQLFIWVEVIIAVSALFLIVTTLLPLTLHATVDFFVLLFQRGMLPSSKAARVGTVERMPIVPFDKRMFAPADDPDDPRPSCECCCCTEDFDELKVIVQTPCSHFYHQSCLGDWLVYARTCPICRTDLDEALWSDPIVA